MMNENTETKDVEEFIKNKINEMSRSDFSRDADLIDSGLLDSLDFLKLVSMIEEEYKISIDFDEVEVENITVFEELVGVVISLIQSDQARSGKLSDPKPVENSLINNLGLSAKMEPPDSEVLIDQSWSLIQEINQKENLLKIGRDIFDRTYKRSTKYIITHSEDVVGLIVVRGDGYFHYLAVSQSFRGEGLGKELIDLVIQEFGTAQCHVRTSNEQAISFYEKTGFEIEDEIEEYFRDNENAYYMRHV